MPIVNENFTRQIHQVIFKTKDFVYTNDDPNLDTKRNPTSYCFALFIFNTGKEFQKKFFKIFPLEWSE